MTLVSPAIVSPIAVVGVKQVDVLVIVTGQELCTQKKGQTGFRFIPFNGGEAEMKTIWTFFNSRDDSDKQMLTEPDLTAAKMRARQCFIFSETHSV